MVAELPQGVRLRAASRDDHEAIARLAAGSGLTTEGEFTLTGPLHVAEASGEVIGAVALEPFGGDALMRATCIHAAWRGRGIGSALVEHVLTEAALEAIDSVYLRTATAVRFFARFGFLEVSETSLPLPVARSMRSGTPAARGTIAMQLQLGPP